MCKTMWVSVAVATLVACGDTSEEPDVDANSAPGPDAAAPSVDVGAADPAEDAPGVDLPGPSRDEGLGEDVPGAAPDVAGPDAPEPPPATNALGEALTLTLDAFTVPAGTERQVCKTINLPVDAPFEVVRIASSMTGNSHHFNLYKVVDDKKTAPVSEAESTLHDCSPADEQLSGDAAYIFGSATAERVLDTPAGVAFALEPGQRLILEQHVINYTLEEVTGGVTVTLHGAAEPASIAHHADVMWFANWFFYLPAGQEVSSTQHCTVPYPVEVVGLMSHFHELGTHFEIETWRDGETELVYEDDDWAHPEYRAYDPPIHLDAGEGLQWTCTWKNTKGEAVGPGPLAVDEMCITFAIAYPSETKSAEPIQCNKWSPF